MKPCYDGFSFVMMPLPEVDPYLGLSSDSRFLLDTRKAVITWPEEQGFDSLISESTRT